MAKTWTDGCLRMTAQSDGVDVKFTCESITVRPSSTSWVAIVKDKDGVATKFEASGAANETYTEKCNGKIFNGAVLSTATNLTSIIFNGTQPIFNS